MNTYILIFIISLFSSLAVTPFVRRLCERFNLLDVPGEDRRIHSKAVPRLGGVAIVISASVALLPLLFIHNLLTQALRAQSARLSSVLISGALVCALGVYDDLRGTNARVKSISLALIGALFYYLGGRVEVLSIPLVGTVHLPVLLGFALTIVWVVGIANAFNLIDGVDGLASGAALFASLSILVVSLLQGRPLITVFALALTGALIGFLRYNFNPASIFLGDSGALFIGFNLAALSVLGTQKASTAVAVAIPILAFGLPVLDTGFTMVRRLISGKPMLEGDREHIHHVMLARGWSQRRVVLILYGVCAALGLISLLFVTPAGTVTGLVLFVVGVCIVLGVNHLRYHEVEELKAGVRRNLTERRARTINNINIRRATRDLSRAKTFGDILSVIEKMLDGGEFVYAAVRIGPEDDARRLVEIIESERPNRRLRNVDTSRGLVNWFWERGDIEREEILGSDKFWTLRVPLSTELKGWGYITFYREIGGGALLLDINYFFDFFQRELASAVERVVSSEPAAAVPLAAHQTSGAV